MASLELRPRSATEIVDAAFQVMRPNYLALLTLSVAAQLPALAMRLSMSIPTDPARVMQWMQTETAISGLALLWVLSFAGNCVVMVAASQLYLGEKIDAGAAFLRGSWRSLLILIPLWLLSSLAIGVGFVFLIVPGVWLALRLIPLFTVSILEDGGWVKAITRTWALGRGHVGHMFLTVLIALLIYIGVAVVGGVVVGVLGTIAGLFKDSGVASVLTTAISAAIVPLFMMMLVILYYDLRIRFEGFDVEIMSRKLSAPAPTA